MNSGLKESNMNWTDIQGICSAGFPTVTLDYSIVGYDPVLAYSQPPIPYVTFPVINTFPDASGTVKIQSLSPYERPRIDHGWHNLSEYDRNNLQYGLNFIRNATKNTHWGKNILNKNYFLEIAMGDRVIYIDD